MTESNLLLELRCPACDWTELCDVAAMRAWLHAAGMLRRAKNPDAALVVELFRQSRERFECPGCDATLLIEEPDDDNWPAARNCQACGQPIPAARVAAVPTATLCAACQEKADRGEPTGQAEYCPLCGGILVLRKAAGTGITRYEMRCGDCGR